MQPGWGAGVATLLRREGGHRPVRVEKAHNLEADTKTQLKEQVTQF